MKLSLLRTLRVWRWLALPLSPIALPLDVFRSRLQAVVQQLFAVLKRKYLRSTSLASGLSPVHRGTFLLRTLPATGPAPAFDLSSIVCVLVLSHSLIHSRVNRSALQVARARAAAVRWLAPAAPAAAAQPSPRTASALPRARRRHLVPRQPATRLAELLPQPRSPCPCRSRCRSQLRCTMPWTEPRASLTTRRSQVRSSTSAFGVLVRSGSAISLHGVAPLFGFSYPWTSSSSSANGCDLHKKRLCCSCHDLPERAVASRPQSAPPARFPFQRRCCRRRRCRRSCRSGFGRRF